MDDVRVWNTALSASAVKADATSDTAAVAASLRRARTR
jgi:hypothetical protein